MPDETIMGNEKVYDEQIAPKLLEIGKICEKHKIPFVAVAEWGKGKIGQTSVNILDECLAMLMIKHCIKTAPNIDSYVMGLIKHAKENNIDTSESIVLNLFTRRHERE